VASAEELEALEADWHGLEQASNNRLPFRTFEWTSCWWRHFAERRLLVEDRLAVQTVRDATGALVGAAPWMLTSRLARGPLRLRFLQPVGADPNITELKGALLAPAREPGLAEALVAAAVCERRGHHWVQWSGVEAGSALEAALGDRPRVQWTRDIPDFVVPLADNWQTFRAGLKRNIRESLRRCYNSLAREGHRFAFEIAETPAAVPAALERFFELHAMRAEVRGTIAHQNVFDTPAARAFLVDVSQRLAARGATRIFAIRIGEEIVAVRVGFVVGDSLYLYYSGYDPAWGKHSVMTTVVAEAIRWAIAQGLRTVNLSTGKDVSKTRWGPREVVYRDAVQVMPGTRSRVALRTYERLRELKANPTLGGALRILSRRGQR
jgi:CelD/BcsL family acetyltransferase involved in cellulose biosynthesis